jgi:predicted nucleotidyltransferase
VDFLPRDFLETAEGLIFAVVEAGVEDGQALGFLRYRREDGRWRKVGTEEANAWLAKRHPEYLFHSPLRDAHLHGVPMSRILRHHQPRRRVRELLEHGARDAVERKALALLDWLDHCGVAAEHVGLTGSLLIRAQRPDSDLDLALYGREAFDATRAAVREGVKRGVLQELSEALWRDTFARRACSLGEAEFRWHEERKFNKAAIDGSKFDIALVSATPPPPPGRKRGALVLRARVVDDRRAFEQPARYRLDHPAITEALSFTHTYVGQAQIGEWVEIAGQVEETGEGLRIVVGSSREARGEYIRVLHDSGGT